MLVSAVVLLFSAGTLRAEDRAGGVKPPPATPPPAYPPPPAGYAAQPPAPPSYPPGQAQPPQPYPPPAPAYPPPPAGYTAQPPPPPYYYPPPPRPDLAPRRLPYDDGDPVPAGYHVEKRARRGGVIAGSIMLGAAYIPLLYIALLTDFDGDTAWLALPVVGPWVAAARIPRDRCNSSDTTYCSEDSVNDFGRFLLVADGIVQGVGAGLAIWGLSGSNVLIRNDYAQVMVTPGSVGGSGYGAVFRGRF
ncbi:MAG: hypothetical protein ABUS79_10030 [Pseudomonadota bacterium]